MIRKKSKFLTRFFLTDKVGHIMRTDIEYAGKDLQDCISKLSPTHRQHVTSFTVYVNGEKVINVPIDRYGKL